ncbi:MAG: hypothetical protein ACOVNR_05980 [Chitinophagaceae bacterium]
MKLNKYVAMPCIALIFVLSCKKKDLSNPCLGKTIPTAQFKIFENLSDTAFEADTIFRDNFVSFKATEKYDSVLWKVGFDSRDFKSTNFGLSFYNSLETIDIKFTGFKKPENNCFLEDKGIYTGTKSITIVEQVQKPFVTVSPLVGKYSGSFTDSPTEVFEMRIDYFDSTKYLSGVTGKNFYWVSNFPNGFIGRSSGAKMFPELQYGRSIEMGYKCFQFGDGGETPMGLAKGWLNKDTLTIITRFATNPYRKFVAVKI